MNEAGTVGILNVGAGDTKLSFDKNNPAERIRAARIVKDMLRRGYALLIEAGKDQDGKPVYQRALDFDEEHCEYIIADFDPIEAEKADQQESAQNVTAGGKTEEAAEAGQAEVGGGAETKRGRGRPRIKVPAESTRAVAVARTAGG